jgi:leucyl-tRNA synthetase
MYREASTNAGVGMHRDVILRYIELQALIISPITPHWAEYIWLEVLKKVIYRLCIIIIIIFGQIWVC